VVFVPFPFTDLSGRKRRPALVVSPEGFHEDDLILCAITSRVPRRLSVWEALLEPADMADRRLPKRSVVRAGKLFTMHRSLVAGRFGSVGDRKLSEVLEKLRALFGADREERGAAPEAADGEEDLKAARTDEAVLALLFLNIWEEDEWGARAWKGVPWESTDRLHEKGLIDDPKSKAKSVVLTEEGRRAAEEAFRKLFAP
jgi:mRNA-degrading endonuclease toxin of MazEF toxin-antitoxin module